LLTGKLVVLPYLRTRALLAGLITFSIVVFLVFGQLIRINACLPVFSDEFDGAQLDPARWQANYKSGSAELQSYVPGDLQVSGGMLRVTAQRQSGQDQPYTSGIITTQGTFSQQFGYFEMRAQVPQGQGLWPAFWLLHTGPQPWTEIDVFEILGNDTKTVYLSNHWHDDANERQFITRPYTGPDFAGGFHTFGVDWTSNQLVWYVDGTPRAQTSDNVPAEPMFILANLAVGGVWPGYPDASTRFPAYLDIDYIRVYAPGCHPVPFGLIGLWP
jgi:beta-glucanase (GH16 family)